MFNQCCFDIVAGVDRALASRTLRPTSLLCRFIRARTSRTPRCRCRSRSGASTKLSENHSPYWTLSLQPPHFQPSGAVVSPSLLESHEHSVRLPALHASVTAWATPALVAAYTNAVSFVPVHHCYSSAPDYRIGTVDKCYSAGHMTSKGPMKDGCKIFWTYVSQSITNVLCVVYKH